MFKRSYAFLITFISCLTCVNAMEKVYYPMVYDHTDDTLWILLLRDPAQQFAWSGLTIKILITEDPKSLLTQTFLTKDFDNIEGIHKPWKPGMRGGDKLIIPLNNKNSFQNALRNNLTSRWIELKNDPTSTKQQLSNESLTQKLIDFIKDLYNTSHNIQNYYLNNIRQEMQKYTPSSSCPVTPRTPKKSQTRTTATPPSTALSDSLEQHLQNLHRTLTALRKQL